MCLFAEKVVGREFQDTENMTFHSVPLERQCRGGLQSLGPTLLEAGCLTKQEVDSQIWCDRDFAEVAPRPLIDASSHLVRPKVYDGLRLTSVMVPLCSFHDEGKRTMDVV